MRIVVADCSVEYAGRLNAYLPRATRLIMVKADGCVAVHADGGAYKPLNWMNAPNHLVEEDGWGSWQVGAEDGEQLTLSYTVRLDHHHHDWGRAGGRDARLARRSDSHAPPQRCEVVTFFTCIARADAATARASFVAMKAEPI